MELLRELIARLSWFIDGMLIPRIVAELATERDGCMCTYSFGVFMRLHIDIDCNNACGCGVGRDETA